MLIAPSAGYSLSLDFLNQFNKVHVIDPDPLAKAIFKKRFPKLTLSWSHKDYFFSKDKQWNPYALSQVAADYPQCQFLICNFL